MNNQITPGIWTVSETAPAKDGCVRAMVVSKLPNGNEATICVLDGLKGQKPGNIAQANARLIAAAPDLLEACKSALEHRKRTHHGNDKLLAILTEVIKEATQP